MYRRDNVCIIMCAKRYVACGSFTARGVLIFLLFSDGVFIFTPIVGDIYFTADTKAGSTAILLD